jgi:periplasmic divalent cation tolerance protein
LQRAAILVLTHLPDAASARRLADSLLGARLAACVNIGAPVESMYHWRGARETATEVPVGIKTTADLYAKVESAIVAMHPYELPEVVAVPFVHGLAGYIDWIAAETQPRPPG